MTHTFMDLLWGIAHLHSVPADIYKIHPLARHFARIQWRRIRKNRAGRELVRLERKIERTERRIRQVWRDGYIEQYWYQRPYRASFWNLRRTFGYPRPLRLGPVQAPADPQIANLKQIGRLYRDDIWEFYNEGNHPYKAHGGVPRPQRPVPTGSADALACDWLRRNDRDIERKAALAAEWKEDADHERRLKLVAADTSGNATDNRRPAAGKAA